jgi:hypothetical protein
LGTSTIPASFDPDIHMFMPDVYRDSLAGVLVTGGVIWTSAGGPMNSAVAGNLNFGTSNINRANAEPLRCVKE